MRGRPAGGELDGEIDAAAVGGPTALEDEREVLFQSGGGDPRAGPADRGARVAEHNEALRPTADIDHRRRDRAHGDLECAVFTGAGGAPSALLDSRFDRSGVDRSHTTGSPRCYSRYKDAVLPQAA